METGVQQVPVPDGRTEAYERLEEILGPSLLSTLLQTEFSLTAKVRFQTGVDTMLFNEGVTW